MFDWADSSMFTMLLDLNTWWWLGVTLLIYMAALFVFKGLSNNMLFHPILLGATVLVLLSMLFNVRLSEYQFYMQPMNHVLGVITVALAVPLYIQIRNIFAAGMKGLAVIVAGGCIAPLCTLGGLRLFGFSDEVKLSAIAKSITTPLAVDTSLMIGGRADLTAAIVVLTGITGAMACKVIFTLTKNQDPRTQGLAVGSIAHAIGTARVQLLSQQSGAFAVLALCINGVLTALIVPLVFAI